MDTWGAGPRNDLTDVAGLAVGHDHRTGDGWLTGTTVVLAPPGGAVGGVDVRGGGPGTRETDLLDPRNMVERVQAVTLTGGSAFGLAAADGVMRHLLALGRGYPVGGPGQVVPIVPSAVVFDLGRGGDFRAVPDGSFGERAAAAATAWQDAAAASQDSSSPAADPAPPRPGPVGAGTGTQAGGLRGGVGSASVVLRGEQGPVTVAALVVVNAVGSPVDPATGELWGARHLLAADVRGLPGWPEGSLPRRPDRAEVEEARRAAGAIPAGGPPRTLATTIGVVATDATLTKAGCARLAGSGHDGLARAVNPIHTMPDGDTLFALSTTSAPAPDAATFHRMLHAAGEVVTRAVVRAILAADTVTTPAGTWRGYRDAFPSAVP